MIRQQHSSGAGGAHIGMFGRPTSFRIGEGSGSGSGGGQGGQGGTGGEGGGAGGGQGGDGGGGAGGTGSGGGAGGEDMLTIMNRVIAAREKASAGKITQQVKDAVAAAIGGDVIGNAVKAALEAAGVKPPPPGGQGGAGGDGTGTAQRSAEMDAELKRTRTEAAEAKQLALEEKTRREAYEARISRDEERTALLGVLTGGKDGRPMVRGELLDDAAEILLKRVVRDPDNPAVILWKGDNWNNRDGADNSLNYEKLDAGIAKWAATPKGKAYAPAAGASGGGTGRPNSGGHGRQRGDEPADDAQVAQIIMRPRG